MTGFTGNTFSTIKADKKSYEETDFVKFFEWITGEVSNIRTERDNYYWKRRDENALWITWAPRILAGLGVIGVLATGLAATLRLTTFGTEYFGADGDKAALLVALISSTLMGAIALYERGTDKSSAYFRHLAIGIAIRNLWNRFQLAVLKEYPALKKAPDQAASRLRLIDLVEAFCSDLDKLVATEQAEWQAAFMESLKELEAVASKGFENAEAKLKELNDAAAKTAAEIKDAAARVEAATRPGLINLNITGAFDGDAIVSIDGNERSRGPGTSLALGSIPVGPHIVSVKGVKDGNALEAAKAIDVTPGVQALTISL